MAEPPGRHERLDALAQDIDNIHRKTPFAISLHAMTAWSCDAIDSAQLSPGARGLSSPKAVRNRSSCCVIVSAQLLRALASHHLKRRSR